MSLLQLTAVGNLGKDPEVKQDNEGKNFVVFSVGVTTKKDTPATWIDVAVFNEKTAQNVQQYLKKGDPVLVQGTPRVDAWAGESGPRASLKLAAHNVTFLPKQQAENREPAMSGAGAGSGWS